LVGERAKNIQKIEANAVKSTILQRSNWTKDFQVHVDALDIAIGVVLT
jgi:hypothetical protein